jgi:hypothetical protein|tara:strand:+ start:1115 stop:1531 length:417 start_codon:yes stop_codon:yes gene_type:complete
MVDFGKISKKEKETIIPLLKGLLNHRSGKGFVFSNSKLRNVLVEFGFEVSDSDVRKYIFYIRNNDVLELLIANQNGYYMANDTTDVKEWIARQEGKIEAMNLTLSSIRRQYSKSYTKLANGDESVSLRGQLDIFEEID